jgi:hypothetical protein
MDSCAWCKRRIKQARTGRPRLYCSAGCKQHAYEQRRLAVVEEAGRQAGREQAIEDARDRTYLA